MSGRSQKKNHELKCAVQVCSQPKNLFKKSRSDDNLPLIKASKNQ